ncbi:MAG: carboxypeptidase regulatory-like domain-containing protein [bacterium]|nr:carboxypeptidase regulatory-like domain-containing protein [bacterium]
MIKFRGYKNFIFIMLASWVLVFSPARAARAASYPHGVTGAQSGWKEGKPAYPLATSLSGGTGILRLLSPITPPKGSASIGAYTRFFTSGAYIGGYNSRRLEGTGVFTYSPTNYLEAAVVTIGTSQRIENKLTHESYLAQALGDTDFSIKAGYIADPALAIGAEARVRLFTRINDIGMVADTISGGGRFLFKFDFSEVQYESVKQFPLRILFNAGYFYDRSQNLAKQQDTQQILQQNYDQLRAFNYALGIGSGGYIDWGLGFEVPQKYLTPFLEFSSQVVYDSANGKFRSFTQSPQRITPGLRITPLENLGVIVGVDVSAGLNKKFGYTTQGLPQGQANMQPAPSWAVILGINYQFGAQKQCPMLGTLTGKVIDIETKLPLENAQITFPETMLSPVVTDTQGKFRTYQPEGKVKISAWKEGYFDHSEMIPITSCEETVMDFSLRVIQKAGLLSGRVADPGGNPLAAVVTISVKPEGASPAPAGGPKTMPGSAPAAPTATVVPPAPKLAPVAPAAPSQVRPAAPAAGGEIQPLPPVQPAPAPAPAAAPVVKPTAPAPVIPPTAKPKAPAPTTKPKAKTQGLLPGGKHMSNLFSQIFPAGASLRISRMIAGILLVGALDGGQVSAQEATPNSGTAVMAQAGKVEALPEKGSLSGTVTDETGKGLAATINFEGSKDSKIPAVKTDPKTGKYRLELPGDKYILKADAAGYEPADKKIEIKVGTETSADFQLKSKSPIPAKAEPPAPAAPEKGTLTGTVTDPSGKGIPATISFEDSKIPAVKADAKTGKYRVELAPDKYKIKVEAPGFDPADKQVKIKAGEDTSEDFQLKLPAPTKGVLLGTVTDPAGKGLPATISFEDSKISAVKADPKTGKYRVELAPDKYKIKVEAPGFDPADKQVKVKVGEETTEDFQLKLPAPTKGVLLGTVTDPAGKGLPATISFEDSKISAVKADAKTGKYRVELAPDKYKIKVEAPGFDPADKQVKVKVGEETTEDFQLKLPAPTKGVLLGTVTDPAGKGLPATISFEDSQIPAVKADPKTGKYRVELARDIYKIKVESNGFEPADRRVRVNIGKDTSEDFKLKPLAPTPVAIPEKGILTGTVTDAAGKPLAATVTFADSKIPALKTDPKTGKFRTELSSGKVSLSVQAPGFEPAAKTVEVKAGAEAQADIQLKATETAKVFPKAATAPVAPVAAPLPEKGILIGTVMDAAGKPLAAAVTFADSKIPALKTDPKTGKFRTELSSGKVGLSVQAPGFEPAAKTVEIKAGIETQADIQLKATETAKVFPKAATAPVAPVAVPLPEKGFLLGTVTDAAGKPLAAMLSFDDPQLPTLKSDPKTGKYRGQLAPGKYQVMVTAQGYDPAEKKIKIKAGEETPVDVQLNKTAPATPAPPEKGILTGTITNEAGKPLAAMIGFDDPQIPVLKTDPKTGKYRRELAPGKYKLAIQSLGYELLEKKTKVKAGEETSADYQLKAVEAAKGYPKPATEAVVAKGGPQKSWYSFFLAPFRWIFGSGEEVAPPAAAGAAEETGEKKRVYHSSAKVEKIVLATDPASGEFNKTLPPGVYTVEANAAGYIKKTQEVVITEDRESHLEIMLEPDKPPTGNLLGSVLNEKEKKPLAAIVSFDHPGVPNLATDPNTGNFNGALAPGKYQATAYAQDYLPQSKAVEIRNGEDSRVDFLLTPTEVPVELGDLRGTVTDKEGKPLAAVISFPESEVPNVASEPDNGKYFLKLPPGDYTVKAAAANYKSQIKNGTVVARQTTEINFSLEPLQLVRLTKKKIQILEKIHFEYDKSDILPDSFPILDEVAQVLSDNPTLKITIEGHSDIMGSHEYNMKLSQARVDSVRSYLIKKGINQDRMTAVGYGSTRPIADNATALGRAKNRRVEFVIQE